MADDPTGADEPASLARSRVRVPEHVVFRSFDTETVLLNLQSGQYHGLNATGGRMLELLQETGSVTVTAETVAREFEQPVETVTRDLAELCAALTARGLIELDASTGE